MARQHAIADGRRRQRAQRRASRLIGRHVGSGSPHLAQSGGVKGTMAAQHASQTGPSVGAASGCRHDTQCGARTMAISPSASGFSHDALTRMVHAMNARASCTPMVWTRELDSYTGSSVISMRSASPHRRSSA
jgi:hypothetical protein